MSMRDVRINSQQGSEIHIFPNTVKGDDNDQIWDRIAVGYKSSPDYTSYLDMDEIDDILLLKDAVDIFISLNNLQGPMKKTYKTQKPDNSKTPQPVPGYCYILEGYLKGWTPAESPGHGTILKTSQEIADELEDMVDIDTCSVASIMSQLGFRVHYDDAGPHGWMMRRDPSAIHTIRPAVPEEDPDVD